MQQFIKVSPLKISKNRKKLLITYENKIHKKRLPFKRQPYNLFIFRTTYSSKSPF